MPTLLDRSYTATRTAFAEALATVPGITHGYRHEPDGPTHPGAAWPVWVRSTYLTLGPACAAETEWDVVVVLPTGSKDAAVTGGDVSIDVVAAAIHNLGIGTVQTAEPQSLAPDLGGLPALVFRVTTATYN